IYDVALGNADKETELHLEEEHSGLSHIRPGAAGPSVTVRVRRGEFLEQMIDPSRPVIMKVDVEGFELQVLKGIGRLLERRELAIIVEVTPEWLVKLGESVEELLEFTRSHGFLCSALECPPTGDPASVLRLRPVRDHRQVSEQSNLLLIRRDSELFTRVSA